MVWDRHTTHRNLSLVSLVHLCVNGSFVPCQALFFYQRVQLEVGAIPGILPHLGWGTMDHSAVSRSTNQPTNQASNQPTKPPLRNSMKPMCSLSAGDINYDFQLRLTFIKSFSPFSTTLGKSGTQWLNCPFN